MNATGRPSTLIVVAIQAYGLAGGTITGRLAAGVSDAILVWADGLPGRRDAAAGHREIDEYLKERERRRLLPASEREEMPNGDEAKPAQIQEEMVRNLRSKELSTANAHRIFA